MRKLESMTTAPSSTAYPNKLVDEVVNCPTTASFSEQDWLELALAALDQAGLSLAQQDRVRALLPVEPKAA